MSLQQKRELTQRRDPEETGGDPFEGQGPNLAQQAAAYAEIARTAREECGQGVDAENELQRRRNRSGQ